MNFLAPLFLFGGLAVAAPILFHLIRRTTRDVTPFSTLMFLEATPPRVNRRSRLENLWLLLLRCLIIALLALGFSRPFSPRAALPAASTEGLGKRIVLLVDTSASMSREDLWTQAQTKAAAHLKKTGPQDEVALLCFDRGIRTLLSFEDWKNTPPAERAAAASQRLAALKPGSGGTRLDAALLFAADLLERSSGETPRPKEIVLFSDLQEGAATEGLQGFQWAADLSVSLEPVTGKLLKNASAHWIAETSESAAPVAEAAAARLRVTNSAESKAEQYTIGWSDAAASKADVYVPAGQSRIVRAPKTAGPAQTALTLSGDEVAFDNTLFILPPQTVQVPVLFVGADAEEDPRALLYYLRRAFPKNGRQTVEILAHRSPDAIPAGLLERAQLIVLGDAASDAALESLRPILAEGKRALVPLASAAGARHISRLLRVPAFETPEAPPRNYALLGAIDFSSPLFLPFADSRFSDFTKIHFWKHRRVDPAALPGSRIIAGFDDGDPALIEAPIGKGGLLIFTSTWRPADSQLALSSKFVPLLNALLEQSNQLPVRKAQYVVGEEVPLPPASQPFLVTKPDGQSIPAAAGSRFAGTDLPGIYSVSPGDLRFVVNLAPEESRLSPMAKERFETLGVPLEKAAAPALPNAARVAATAAGAEVENKQKLWRWLIVAALGVLFFETFLAAKLSGVLRASTAANP